MPEARVQYTGVPTAEPEMPRGLPQINVQVPHPQFSDAVGRAMANLGHGYGTLGEATKAMGQAFNQAGRLIDQTGDELYTRAVALQEITNQTATNEAISAYELEQGMADVNFKVLKGNNAVGQFDKYRQETEDRRTKFRDTLVNDAQKRAFDARSLSSMGRSILNGAGHAGVEQKNAYINSLNADVEAWKREVANNPFDEGLMNNARDGLARAIKNKNAALGNEDKVAQIEIAEQMEKLLAGKLVAAAKERPFETWDAFQEVQGQLSGPIRDQVEHSIKDNMRNAGALGAANRELQDIRTGKMDETRTITQRVDAAVEHLPPVLRDDDIARKQVRRFIEEGVRDHIQERQIQQYNNTNTVLSIVSGRESNGEVPKDINAFLAHPRGRAVWDGSDDIQKEKIREVIWQANIRAMRVDPITSTRNREVWLGLRLENPQEFMKRIQENPVVLFGQMNREDRNSIMRMYESMLKNPQTNPDVTKAEKWLRDKYGTILDELDVAKKTKANEIDYYRFKAGIAGALEEWQASNPGKKIDQPTFDKELAPVILRFKPGTGWFPEWVPFIGGTAEEPPFWRFEEVPEEWEKARRRTIMEERGIPEEDIPKTQIQSDYVRHMFRESVKKRSVK